MGVSVTNDNLIRLKKLSEKLCEAPNDEYKNIVKELKKVVDEGHLIIEESVTTKSKIKCYESMCFKITNILSAVNLI